MDINGKVAVVTGGASGIGQAVARRIAGAGGKVVIFDLNEEAGQAMVAELGADNCVFATVNVVDEDSAKAGIEAAVGSFGTIHIIVNCAGIGNAAKTLGRDGPFPMDVWSKVIAVNLTGTFNVLRLCAEVMAKHDPVTDDGARGAIINTASVAAYEGQMGQAAYSASKGGVIGMTLPIARDLMNEGIRVNTILPGIFKTPLLMGLPEKAIEALNASVPFPKRLGEPEEYAKLALCMIETGYFNGEDVRLDGAIRMAPR